MVLIEDRVSDEEREDGASSTKSVLKIGVQGGSQLQGTMHRDNVVSSYYFSCDDDDGIRAESRVRLFHSEEAPLLWFLCFGVGVEPVVVFEVRQSASLV